LQGHNSRETDYRRVLGPLTARGVRA